MRVLVACEFSGIVRDAFIAAGHDALSVDLLPTERPGPHYRGDVRDVLADGFDLMVAHPPCTHLAVSGARWFAEKARAEQTALDLDILESPRDQVEALQFVADLLAAPIPRIALENPRSVISSRIRPADQMIHPWQYGHGERKETCLWLVNLPPLVPTRLVAGRRPTTYLEPPGPSRARNRSRTYPGIAEAMAQQWGNLT